MRTLVGNLYTKHALQIRFLCVGGFNTLIGITCFPLLYFLLPTIRTHYVLLMVIAQIFCVSFSYMTNKFFVFRTKKTNFFEYVRFISFYNIIFIINLIILPLLVTQWHFNPAKIQLLINILIAVGSYFWHRYITFNVKNPKRDTSR